ncbi:RNA polymerase sigma factor [Solirubrobacter soli]|uniref:RNA polymerase sigma factor n=1 Tax=Solirubrobacter soli TaxID=363832 RepID=UPI0003FD78CF|nr:sigma-70 family RNA polymerase sigma factor [Solirubrobacter soli]
MLHHDRNYLQALDQGRPRPGAHPLERIVLAAATGDQRAWNTLSTRFGHHVRRIARAHGLNGHDADDVAQETLLQLARNIVRIREPRAVGAWLRTTARRESLRAIESRNRARPAGADLGAELGALDDGFRAVEAASCGAALRHALNRLPDRHRLLMTALFAETPESYADISARLGFPQGSIGPIRARCLDRLRGELDAEAFQ